METKFVNILPMEGVLKANIVDSHIHKRKILVAPHTAEMEIGVDFLPMEPVSSSTGGLEYKNSAQLRLCSAWLSLSIEIMGLESISLHTR